jgi:hypothetical protein
MGCESDLVNQTNTTPEQNDNISFALDREAAKNAFLASKETDTGPQTYDKILAEIALEVSGYGGHFFDEEGVLNVWLLDDQERNVAESVLRQYNEAGVLRIDEGHITDFRSRQGRYDFLQLYNWKTVLRHDVLAMEAVTLLDINEAENNITIGIKNLGEKGQVLERVQQIGFPDGAFKIIERNPATYYTQQDPTTHYIKNKRTTLAGGLRIQYVANSNTYNCTLGPVAQRNGVKGFIVNSHCSETRFSVDNEKYYQAKTSDRHIATETVDPPAFFSILPCPPGRICAYADAVFAEWKNRGTWNLGLIYETEYSGHVTGSTNRVGANFNIVSDINWPSMGTFTYKVGQRTGWTYGNVYETCADIPVGGSNITMLCQYTTDAGADHGDSGAPIFNPIPYPYPNVGLFGILWGGVQNSSPQITYFSPTPAIRDHLGGTINFQ